MAANEAMVDAPSKIDQSVKETVKEKSHPEPLPVEAKEEVEKPKQPDNLCSSQKECDLQKLKGFDFCHKHILEDKASPFRPCSFVSKTTGKKCTNPAPKLTEREKTYCLIHTKDSELRKVVEERSKKHNKRKLSESSEINESFIVKDIHVTKKNQTKRLKINEGDFPKRDEMLRVDSSWHGDYESDTESLDNEIDEPLRHAGVWTAEEVTKICRDKLLRLRSLYMSQFERLKHVFKNKRRKYIVATKAEEGDATDDTKKKKALSAFDIATKKYNKRFRTDALLQKQSKDKRFGGSPKTHQILPHQRCTHYTDGNRCIFKIVPSTRFCIKHICHDPNQILFLPCTHGQDEHNICGTPVPNVSQYDRCLYHLPHETELCGDNIKEKLEKAKERQMIKEKEKEERQKEALRQQILMNSVVKVEPSDEATSVLGHTIAQPRSTSRPSTEATTSASQVPTKEEPVTTNQTPTTIKPLATPPTKSVPQTNNQSPTTNYPPVTTTKTDQAVSQSIPYSRSSQTHSASQPKTTTSNQTPTSNESPLIKQLLKTNKPLSENATSGNQLPTTTPSSTTNQPSTDSKPPATNQASSEGQH